MDGVPELSAGVISLLVFLLPGFVAAWVFYGITSHPRPEKLERVVEALIFTFVVQALTPLLKWCLLWIGEWHPLLPWGKDARLVASFVVALAVGTCVAVCTNKDLPHRWLRNRWGLTSRTSHPSEWFCAFSSLKRPVILNFKDGRRLQGWPKEWPVSPLAGQFLLQDPVWHDDGAYIELPQIDSLLVQVTDVEFVEFMKEGGIDVQSQ
jgi:hypothetical protein